MKTFRCSEYTSWEYRVELDESEWPKKLDDAGDWLDRPIRKWVNEKCRYNTSFSCNGTIYFESIDDYTEFNLTWG